MKIKTSLGPLWLDANQKALTTVSYQPIEENPVANQAVLQQAKTELIDYLAQQRTDFTVPIAFTSGTSFQQEVWQALLTIPYGQTRSYQEIAEQIGRPKAVRAIGQANRVNALPIIVPCHRVIGKNGKLTGYIGASNGGLEIKAQLLDLEKE